MVFRFDRFARSTKHLANALSEFENLGIQFISYNENIDTTSPMGQAMFTMISAMAQLERDIIRERVVAGLKNAKAKGKKLGRKVTVDHEMVMALSKTLKPAEIAKKLSISQSMVYRIIG